MILQVRFYSNKIVLTMLFLCRHLSDHGAPPVEMSWVGAGPVFHYFAPHTIPEFDSYKTSTISSDVEQLLRRIFTLIPEALQAGKFDRLAEGNLFFHSNHVLCFEPLSFL